MSRFATRIRGESGMLAGEPKTVLRVVGSMDSGQGSCLILRNGATSVAIDCGASPVVGDKASQETTRRVVEEIVASRPELLAVSHFHRDHWGALRGIVEAYRNMRRPLPAIVSTDTTWNLLEGYLFEGSTMSSPMLETLGFRAGQGAGGIRLIPSRHSVPGSAGVFIPGRRNVFYTSDFWAINLPNDLPKIDVLIVDSPSAEKASPRQDNEADVRQNIMHLVRGAVAQEGGANVYIALFSTQLDRACWLEREVKRVTGSLPVVKGASLFYNINKVRPDAFECRSSRVVLTTGVWAQGEGNYFGENVSALVRLSNGTDRHHRLKKGDLVILSGSIPVWSISLTSQIKAMCERISSLGVRLVVDTSAPREWSQFAERREVHASGHGNMPEIAGLINKIGPRQVLPFHASQTAREKVARYCLSRGMGVIAASQSSQIIL